ncbi:hypothetical protein RRG08_066217 [Elysia crispata]|uniref:Uncharacterized protein n=1 Tax=Elysia crispata TaxID=231223 RepID=A0AAE1BEG1_9GAST|nr:hypothetical protein RRG08_066217 [Elysia crispata]
MPLLSVLFPNPLLPFSDIVFFSPSHSHINIRTRRQLASVIQRSDVTTISPASGVILPCHKSESQTFTCPRRGSHIDFLSYQKQKRTAGKKIRVIPPDQLPPPTFALFPVHVIKKQKTLFETHSKEDQESLISAIILVEIDVWIRT